MPSIVLYYYHGSPWGAKVATYLNLRGIEYTECHQPIGWPRPDLEALNIRYRRIPLLAIGKDIYYDTSLILAKLETLYPDNRLGATATQPTEQALETLIEKWAAPIFPLAFHLLPTDMPLLKDSALVKDRTELWGQDFNPAGIEKGRTGSLVEMRENYAFLESLLQDGREWLLNSSNTQKLGLADLHGIYTYFFFHPLPFLSPLASLPGWKRRIWSQTDRNQPHFYLTGCRTWAHCRRRSFPRRSTRTRTPGLKGTGQPWQRVETKQLRRPCCRDLKPQA